MPVRWRLTLFNALVIGAILLALGVGMFAVIRAVLLYEVRQDVRGHASAVARTVGSGGSLGDAKARGLSLEGTFVVVRDGHGRVVSETVALPDSARGEKAIWRHALNKGVTAGGPARITGEDPHYVYAQPVRTPGGAKRVVEAGRSYSVIHETVEVVGRLLLAGFAGAFLLSIAGAYALARAAFKPVDEVTVAAREMGESDLSRRLPVANPKDEIGRLTTTINSLLARLEAAFARREEAVSRREEALEAQRRFAADANHELRTPVANIAGYARMLGDWGLEDRRRASQGLHAIERESDRVLRLVEDLLTLTRGEDLPGFRARFERTDLADLLGEAAENARAIAGGRVTVEYETPGGPLEAVADPEGIRRAVAILLENAVKYTPAGGTIRLSGRETTIAGGRNTVEISVSDTGYGIPEDQLPLIFERFHRVRGIEETNEQAVSGDPAAAGSGLGLAIARQIAEAHDGTVEARSVQDNGSVFTLRLPQAGPDGSRSP